MKTKSFEIEEYYVPIFLVLCALSITLIAVIATVGDANKREDATKRYEICLQSATTDTQRNACNEVHSVR